MPESEISSTQKPQKTDNVVARWVGEDLILVPIRTSSEEPDSIYTLNGVGGRVWALVDGERTVAEIGKEIAREFDIGEEEAQADVVEFLDQLLSVNFITIEPQPEASDDEGKD